MVKRCAFVAALLLLSRPALAADGRAADEGVAISGGVTLVQPQLGSSNFTGSGTPYGSNASSYFSHSGREIGVRAPVLFGADLRIAYIQRYYEVGGQFFASTSLGDAASATNSDAASQVQASSLTAIGGGIHGALAIPLGHITVLAGADLGVRGFSVPITADEPTVCHNKYGTYSCPETATSTQPYVQPRITFVMPLEEAQKAGFFIAPWVGMDLYPSASWAGGLSIGWGFSHGSLR